MALSSHWLFHGSVDERTDGYTYYMVHFVQLRRSVAMPGLQASLCIYMKVKSYCLSLFVYAADAA